MAPIKRLPKEHWIWISILSIVIILAGTFILWPESLPASEGQRLVEESADYDVIIIFNPGGWGDATLEQATDFTPILYGIQQTLTDMGYRSTIIPYARTPSGISGTLTGIKEYLNTFKGTSEVQMKDLEYLAETYPEKHFILTGFSNGGALTDATLQHLGDQDQIYAIVAGVPCWYTTFSADNSLVLDNDGQDSLADGHKWTMFKTIVSAPFKWVRAKITGESINIATSYQFPGHEYPWASEEVSAPIGRFLERIFKK